MLVVSTIGIALTVAAVSVDSSQSKLRSDDLGVLMPQQGIRQVEILNGWKEIANYLGKGVRTVQRYERKLGLPVRRPAGRSSGSVIATRAEINAWIGASPLRKAFKLSLHAVEDRETVKGLKQEVREMHRLREECAQLREEMRASREALKRR
jgi:hypothetical protein